MVWKVKSFFLALLFTFMILAAQPVAALEHPSDSKDSAAKKSTKLWDLNPQESLANNPFVLETDEGSGRESLNRISGQIDMGFSPEGNSYKSENQYKPGPFSRQES